MAYHKNTSALTMIDETKKPSASSLQLTTDALLASEQGMLVVGDICESVMNTYAYCCIVDRSRFVVVAMKNTREHNRNFESNVY